MQFESAPPFLLLIVAAVLITSRFTRPRPRSCRRGKELLAACGGALPVAGLLWLTIVGTQEVHRDLDQALASPLRIVPGHVALVATVYCGYVLVLLALRALWSVGSEDA